MVRRGLVPIAMAVALVSGCGGKKDGPEFHGSTQMINDNGILYALGDSEPYTGPIIDYHPNGVKSYQVEVKDGVAQGTATEWYKSGQKMTETTLENGQATGMIKGWYSSGKKEYEMPIKNGEIDGVGTEYHETGAKKSKTPYVNGSRKGRELGYAEAGYKLWEADYRDDKLHGDKIEFYASGKTNSLTPYVNGLNKGTSIGWYETGGKAWQAKWDGNKPVGTHYEWFPDSKNKQQSNKLKQQISYASGKKIMKAQWYEDGKKKLETSYDSNEKPIAQKRWDADGKSVFASGTSASPTAPVKDLEKPKPNPNAPGRQLRWTTVKIKMVYEGKTTDVLEKAFGLPDAERGDTWVYNNMIIFDPTTRRRLTTVNFLIRDGKVLLVEAN